MAEETPERPIDKLVRLGVGLPKTKPLTAAEKVGLSVSKPKVPEELNYPHSSGLVENPAAPTAEQEKWRRLAAERRGNITPATARARIDTAKRETGPFGQGS